MRSLAVIFGLMFTPIALADEAPPSPDGCKCAGASAPIAWAPLLLAGLVVGRRRR